ncbi:MAG TPA: DUF1638 domain-containing protein [Burkholderiaceae bacterium]
MTLPERTLVIACGALARELMAVIRASGLEHLQVQCLPADLHNRPERITDAVRQKIHAARGRFAQLFVAYGDCGTGGALDRMLVEEGVERIAGAHCYEFLSGSPLFEQLSDEEPGTFYLTDFLLRHFDRIVIRGLGLDRFPHLTQTYFGNYRRLVYLAQQPTAERLEQARAAARRLGLAFESRNTGLAPLAQALTFVKREAVAWAG